MFEAKAYNVVCAFWGYARRGKPKLTTDDEGILADGIIVHLNVQINDSHEDWPERPPRESTQVSFLICAPTNVWARTGLLPRGALPWKFLSSHDSCWRDAISRCLSDLYFEFSGRINSVREKSGRGAKAPVDLQQFCWVEHVEDVRVRYRTSTDGLVRVKNVTSVSGGVQ
jgi:hypothetical protein